MENEKQNTANIPVAEEETSTDTTPKKDVSQVELKFNKETVKVPYEKAVELAQKGLKYEQICEDFDRLKTIAQKSGQTVPEFLNTESKKQQDEHFSRLLEQSGGNRELAEHVMKLEADKETDGLNFSELEKEFPEIDEIGKLPECVVKAASEKGRNLLDEYLRYLHKTAKNQQQKKENAEKAQNSAIGSQKSETASNKEATEFLKGIWNR